MWIPQIIRKSGIWIVVFIAGLSCAGMAQELPADSSRVGQPVVKDSLPVLLPPSDSTRPKPPQITVPKLDDSTVVWYNYAAYPERFFPVQDTLPSGNFRFYDPARRHLIDYGTLGNLGSPARPMLFQTSSWKGFNTGVHPYHLYRLDAGDLAFFRSIRTYSDVFFTQGRTQNENQLRARVSRTFEGGTTFALDYKNSNNLGQFQYQAVKNNSLSVGISWPASDHYHLYLIHTRNTHRQQENGGIVSDTVFGNSQFTGPITAEIRLPGQNAFTRLADQTIYAAQHLNLAQMGQRNFRAKHTLQAQWQQYKFYDENLGQDSTFFNDFLVDTRGLRNAFDVFRLDNQLELLTFRQSRPDRPSDRIGLGLSHSWIQVKEDIGDTSIQNLFLDGRISISPGEQFALSAAGSIGLLPNFGEYRVDASLLWRLRDLGQLELGLQSTRRPSTYLQQRLLVSQRVIWDNQFEKPVETSLSAKLMIPRLFLTLGGNTHLVNNYIYFDQNAVAQQTTSPLQVIQLYGQFNLKLGPVHFDNTFAFQQANRDDVFRLPDWFSKNSLYYNGGLFKKRLAVTAGVDFRINSEFRPDAYHPLHWQFYLQDSLTQQPYPWMDAFAAFKVDRFRFFFRYENIFNLIENTSVFYQAAHHPLPFATFRFGIAWRFLDSNAGSEQPGQQGNTPGIPPPRSGF